MGNLSIVVRQLRTERERAQSEVHRIDAALAALGSASSNGSNLGGHTMSVAARRKISLAQKARWAKQKQAPKPKHTMAVASRKKIAAAQRARWAKVKARQKAA
jgi:hypothetical protein